jgi:hypothetical protein
VERFGDRRRLTGEPLEPRLPVTAAAFAAGEIGPEHAAMIADAVEAIPVTEQGEHAGRVEATLLEHARASDPRTVKLLGQRILAHLDPDGPSPEEQGRQQSHRRLALIRLADGTGLLEGYLTRPAWRSGTSSSPRSPRNGPMTRWVRMTGARRSGCTTRSRKPAADSSPPATCRIRPDCPAS